MRKALVFLLSLFAFLICGQAWASVVKVTVADDLNIDVYGLGADITTLSTEATALDFEITASLPSATWAAWIATNPKLGLQAVDYFASTPLGGGLILTIESTLDFSLAGDSFILAMNNGDPYTDSLYDIVQSDDGGVITYTISTPVPIPSGILLLGPGLIGILGIRRKFKNAAGFDAPAP